MADEVSELLRSWNLESLIQDFQENEFDLEALKGLSEDLVGEIIKPIGKRIHFIQCWEKHFKKKLRKNFNDRSVDNDSTSENSENENPNTDANENASNEFVGPRMSRQLHTLNVEDILNQSEEGRIILKTYKTKKIINRIGRIKLVDILSSFLIDTVKGKANREDFRILSEGVTKLFPKEDALYYYVPPVLKKNSVTGKSCSCRGRIALKYWSKLKHLKELSGPLSDDQENIEENNDCDVELEESILWLKNHQAPWETVLGHWKVTSDFRRSQIIKSESTTLCEIFENWPILRNPSGHKLIEEDFTNWKFSNELNAIDNWKDFFEQVQKECSLNKKKQKIERVRLLGEMLESPESTTEGKVVVQMCLLAYLVAPKGRLRQSKTDHWKFSSAECEESIFLHATTAGDVSRIQEENRRAMKEKGLKVQPFIVVIGPEINQPDNFFVCIDDQLYEISTALKAIDICFKSFHVFHAFYPPPSNHLWYLIQRSVYKFETVFDKPIASILDILTSISYNVKDQ